MASQFTVERVTDVAAFEEMRFEWNALVEEMEHPEVFYLWEWNFYYFRRFRTEDELFIVVVRDGGGRIVAIAPLCVRRTRRLLCSVRVVETIVVNLGDYRNFLVHKDHHRGSIVAAIFGVLRVHESSWDVIDLAQFSTREPTTFHVWDVMSRYGDWTSRMQVLTAVAVRDLRGGRAAENTRQTRQVRNRGKTLRSRGFTIHIGSDRLEEFWPTFMSLHRMAWPSSPFHEERGRLFYDDLRMSDGLKGRLEFSYVELAGQPVAMHFGFVDQRKVYFYMPTMDRSFRQERPGAVLLHAMIEHYTATREQFDFLRGLEGYKAWYTDDLAANLRFVVNRSRSIPAFAYNAQELARRFITELGLPRAIFASARKFLGRFKVNRDSER